MTDDLLDEATRLADRLHDVDPPEVRVLRALVERVRAAEEGLGDMTFNRDVFRRAMNQALAERDEARGKLDAVRAWLDDVHDDGTEWRDLRRLRAILDGSSPDA